MLEGLRSILSSAGNRPASAVVRRVLSICALLGLLSATLAVAPAKASGLDATPTRSVFFGFTVEGDVVHLRIGMRNTGEGAWDAAQGMRLRRLDKDGAALAGESYPVEHTVRAGETANWDIVISPVGAGLKDWRYAMFEGDRAFGSPARAMIIVLPNLEGTRQLFRSGMGPTVRAMTEWANRTFGSTISGFSAWVRGLVSRVSGGFSQGSIE